MNANKRLKLIRTLALIVAIIFFFHYLIKYISKNKNQGPTAPTVVIQKPKLKEMAEYVTQTGTMVAYNSVDLVARIEGYLQKIEFTDGTFVKKDKELFIIEPEPYMEKVKEAQASVAAQKASYTYASSEYERQKRMYKQNATSLNNVEKWAAQVEVYKAEIAKAEANAVNAEINYSYTHVRAPFDGRIGRHLVDVGNLVGNGKATDLATIEQIDPIYVYFNLNELDLIKLREAAKANGFQPEKIDEIPVYVAMQNETGYPHKGKLNFVNTGLNASTGTLEFRALLNNKDLVLLPGLFVQVRIPITKPMPQLTVPDTAIQYDQIGAYLFVVDTNNNVVLKRVVPGAVEQGIRAITKGLSADDNVVVAGTQNAIPGNQVTPVQQEKK
jgi:RND family efflux transporter MFP subunit